MYKGASIGDVGMEYITGSPTMLGVVIKMTEEARQDSALILALMEVESAGNPYVATIEATQRSNLQFARPAACVPDTETLFQKTRWGLMQIRGSVARSLGFDGWLPELVEPCLNLEIALKYIGMLSERFFKRHGLAGVIAAYRTEAPRKIGDGFVNQPYVDTVLKLIAKYTPVVAEQRETALAALADANKQRGEGEQMSSGTEVEMKEAALQLGESGDLQGEIPTADHTLETLNALSKAQLVGLAKEKYGLVLAVQAKKAHLIERILVAQADMSANAQINAED